MRCLALLLNGSVDEKIEWIFDFYDVDSDGIINAEVRIYSDSENGDYRAVPVAGMEHSRVDEDNRLPVVFRILTGFPPRYFVRLDPR